MVSECVFDSNCGVGGGDGIDHMTAISQVVELPRCIPQHDAQVTRVDQVHPLKRILKRSAKVMAMKMPL